ncbi:MAG: CAP domain-containing protein [bacterium]|nr:CAP domain-containing protein [bacterium]
MKQRLHDALAAAKTDFAREMLTDLLERMDEMYPLEVASTETATAVSSTPEDTLSTSSSVNNGQTTSSRPSLRQDTDRYQLSQGHIDITVLQQTRLGRVNDLRAEHGRTALSVHVALDKTAAERSKTMKNKSEADHKRFPDSGYYDYGVIEQWFRDRGVEFVNVSRATFTENVGRGGFHCDESDCTDEAIQSLHGVFDFYVREEGTTNDAHRRTLIHPLYTVIGFGIAVDESIGRLYVTTHYGTQVK